MTGPMARPAATATSVHQPRNSRMVWRVASAVICNPRVAQKAQRKLFHRVVHKFVVDRTNRLRKCGASPYGGKKNGNNSALSGSCAGLVKSEHAAIDFLASSFQSLANPQEVLRWDFLARAPIDDGGRPYPGHAGCLGRSTEGAYDIVN